ncbi:bifunctional methylenetetrahydrofolate dehydrogenase/methenyltetrahydrofolate cyclohydrolase FolD [Candidatus Purcelliella pentastirinorum]|uniref:bifunctional methylenetetrahydrofolate dehydrogenase/methenyltetrahydrofolate cyclohydrolase FolD n=1 Tax=Candidatus Purcelliella pentastirinorum TaxID=472834 RepID=UPI002367C180|nr:bifunctional methylenetetrahydrofolate dehydrogenase/methenyltetrahydrofolate cyclohydrolase FolD [Candidatus Purcelliella pentastirinorum]WDI78818.1 bifunctional methylenetetrahydrofolate dehydrogenase/methenyltetrahydrofolate cyclohydrolase FolD [Candidatus Purcelliella pentastirinorum]WDR79951.1 bifunctional methylenetetrahydrofolate dehydrogenase/methenyltetrahydrofolate cyclohydrolase FolD [Candidatus Purcelliella pentastirinorum]
MIAKIINCKFIADDILSKVIKKLSFYQENKIRSPRLDVILVGDDIASNLYVKNKYLVCKDIGIICNIHKFSNFVSEKELLFLIDKLNNNVNVDGILIQLPLPKIINTVKILENISIFKDVDGLNPYNIGCLYFNKSKLRPCASSGVISIIKYLNINTYGLNVVIVGASDIVGKPIGIELLLIGCTVTITNRYTNNLRFYLKNADLLIVAIGKSCFIHGSWIKSGAIVIDVGINLLDNGKIVGDVDFISALYRASHITPVPGGVGVITVATVMKNTLIASKYNLINM